MPSQVRDIEDVVVDRCKRVVVRDCDEVVLIGCIVTKQTGCLFVGEGLPVVTHPEKVV